LTLLRWPDEADHVLDEHGRKILRDLRSAALAQRRRHDRGCGLLVLAALVLLVGIVVGIVALVGSIF
jgi:hypothetical protein